MRQAFIQLLISICVCAYCLYNYLDNLNDLTRLRLLVPEMQKELNLLQIDYQEKSHQWRQLTSARHLLEIKNNGSFNHLRQWRSPENLSNDLKSARE